MVKSIKKNRFEKWLLLFFLFFFLLFLLIIFGGASYMKGLYSNFTSIFLTIGQLIFILFFFIPLLFILNMKLPQVQKSSQIVNFIVTSFIILLVVYLFMAIILFHYLYELLGSQNLLIVKSMVLMAMAFLLIYRISLYFEDIISENFKKEIKKVKIKLLTSIQKNNPPFSLHLPSFFTNKFFIEKLKTMLFDFIAISIFINFFAFSYGLIKVPPLQLNWVYLVSSITALSIEIFIWYGLVKNRYWK